jgi:capsular exopolysaccharide synthesis family protein
MSIVERALQKAQLRARQEEAAPVPPAVRDGADTAVPPPAATDPASVASTGDSNAAGTERRTRGMPATNNPTVSFSSENLRQVGRLPPEEWVAQTEEEIRRIKWPVLGAITGEGSMPTARNNVVLVTSAVPAEGKTFVSLNLALSIVRDRRMKVILVDGDVARPGMSESLAMQDHVGVNDLLANHSMGVAEVLHPTDIDGLWFIPAGRWHQHSPELFASDRMKSIVESLSELASPGVVIIDSPPLLAATEAQAIGRNIGQVLVVVRANSTEQGAVMAALEMIDKSTPTYTVLNCVEASIVSRYYGRYYYGYNYRYGRQSRSADA